MIPRVLSVRFFAVVCLILAANGFQGLPAGAQDEQSPAEEPEETSSRMSQADRLMGLERTIESDKENLDRIKQDLADREALFNSLSSDIKEAEARFAEETQRLEEMPSEVQLNLGMATNAEQ